MLRMSRNSRSLPVLALVLLGGAACQPSSVYGKEPAPVASAAPRTSSSPARATSVAPAPTASGSAASPGLPGHHHDVAAPELVHFDGKRGRLGGFLYKPEGTGPFPAIVFNHGSEKLPGNKYGQALFYVPRGFVLFVPHRLGHGQSPGDYIVDARDREPGDRQAAALVSLLDAQVADVADATAYLESLPFVNRAAVAMVGCSFGGIETLLASERDLGIRAAVDFAGAAMAWGESAPLQARMRAAARRSRVPVFFAQAANDFDTRPSMELAKEMASAGKPHALRIFPATGATAEEGHAFCSGGMQPPWGDDVIAFLAEHGVQGKARSAGRPPVP